MRPSTASRHLGAAKVLDLLTAIDRTVARYRFPNATGMEAGRGTAPAGHFCSRSAGGSVVNDNHPLDDTGRDHSKRLARPVSIPFRHAEPNNAEAGQ